MTMEGSGVMPVYDLNNRTAAADGAGFGGGWMWVVMLFFLLAWGGGGFGGFGGGANGAVNTLTNEFLYTNLNSTLDRGFNQLANQNFGIQKDLCQGFGGVQAAIAQSTFAAQQCCCETNRNIDAVRYENAKNTCDITSAIHAEGEATRALMTANVMQELRDQLQAAQLQLGTLAQTSNIINAVRPFPQPAYITCSPYQSATGVYGCGGCDTV